MVDGTGLTQVHTSNNLIEAYNVKEDDTILGFLPDILANQSTLETYRYSENGIDGYLITRYIEDMDWYLMVKKDTSVLRKTLYSQVAEVLIIVMLVILGVLLTTSSLIKRYQIKMNEMAITDQLTGLLNRRGFDQVLYEALKNGELKEKGFAVFIFDIDDFKALNDSYGHLFGDKVIAQLASIVKKNGYKKKVKWPVGGAAMSFLVLSMRTARKRSRCL